MNRLPAYTPTKPKCPTPKCTTPQTNVPGRHAEAILAHLARNLQNIPGPLMLALDGPPGTGKTFAVQSTLDAARVMRVTLTGADLESGEAGRPADLIRRGYLRAAATIEAGKPAVMILDDFDAAVGRWDENTTYTVNTQLIYTELMHLADSPTRVDDRKVRRVPIIITCNNLGRLYGPMCRPGRMQIHPWTLTPGEQIEVVQGIFKGLDGDDLIDLIDEFKNQPVAFFADLKRRAEEDGVRAAVRRFDPAEALRQALKGKLDAVPRPLPALSELIALGRRMEEELVTRNHLEDAQ